MLNKKIGLIASSAAMLAVAFSAFSFAGDALPTRAEDQISAVKSAIKAAGAKWEAGETSLSRLSEQEQMLRVGLNFETIKTKPLIVTKSVKAAPSSVDWRDNGGSFVTPIRNQGQCGSCWAFSMTAGLEAYALRQNNTPNTNLDLSEQVLISCSGVGSCNGGTINPDYLQSTGLPKESAYPYTATDGTCASAASGWQNSTYKIDSWGSVDQTVTALKSAIANYGPVPAAFMVYQDLMHYTGGVYSFTSGKKLGGHAILVVGYNDDGQYFIVKNSWGTSWGENGYFRIAYSQVTSSKVMFGLSAVAYQGGNASSYSDSNMETKLQESSTTFNSDAAAKRIEPIMNQRP